MIPHGTPEPLFIVAWAFLVRPEHQRDFEHVYGPRGDWVRLFRSGEGYIQTELHHDPESAGRYVTLDSWRSREQYEAFRERAKSAYQEIDARCERLTDGEQLIGEFADIASLREALPQFGSVTLVAPHFIIRSAQAGDVAEILRIERAAPAAAHWPQEAYAAVGQGDTPPRIALIAEGVDRKLCGFIVARIVSDECELENIVVSATQSRQGIGSALLQELSQAAQERGVKRIFLEVRESNEPARRLYTKFGFVQDGHREGYYRNPSENAVLYSWPLCIPDRWRSLAPCKLP